MPNGHSNPADMYFGCLDGDWNADHDAVFGEFGSDNADLWSEVYVGRAADALQCRSQRDGQQRSKITSGRSTWASPKEGAIPGGSALPVRLDDGPISLDGAQLAECVRISDSGPPGLVVNRNYQNPGWPGSEQRDAAGRHRFDEHRLHDSCHSRGARLPLQHVVRRCEHSQRRCRCADQRRQLMNLNLLNCTSSAFTYEAIRRALSAQSQWRRRLRGSGPTTAHFRQWPPIT